MERSFVLTAKQFPLWLCSNKKLAVWFTGTLILGFGFIEDTFTPNTKHCRAHFSCQWGGCCHHSCGLTWAERCLSLLSLCYNPVSKEQCDIWGKTLVLTFVLQHSEKKTKKKRFGHRYYLDVFLNIYSVTCQGIFVHLRLNFNNFRTCKGPDYFVMSWKT